MKPVLMLASANRRWELLREELRTRQVVTITADLTCYDEHIGASGDQVPSNKSPRSSELLVGGSPQRGL